MLKTEQDKKILNILVIGGDNGIDFRQLVHRYITDEFVYLGCLGENFAIKILENFKLNIGILNYNINRFSQLTESSHAANHFQVGKVVLFCIDVTNKGKLDNAQIYLDLLKKKMQQKDVQIIGVATKCDELAAYDISEIRLKENVLADFAVKNGLKTLIYTSARKNINVDSAFGLAIQCFDPSYPVKITPKPSELAVIVIWNKISIILASIVENSSFAILPLELNRIIIFWLMYSLNPALQYSQANKIFENIIELKKSTTNQNTINNIEPKQSSPLNPNQIIASEYKQSMLLDPLENTHRDQFVPDHQDRISILVVGHGFDPDKLMIKYAIENINNNRDYNGISRVRHLLNNKVDRVTIDIVVLTSPLYDDEDDNGKNFTIRRDIAKPEERKFFHTTDVILLCIDCNNKDALIIAKKKLTFINKYMNKEMKNKEAKVICVGTNYHYDTILQKEELKAFVINNGIHDLIMANAEKNINVNSAFGLAIQSCIPTHPVIIEPMLSKNELIWEFVRNIFFGIQQANSNFSLLPEDLYSTIIFLLKNALEAQIIQNRKEVSSELKIKNLRNNTNLAAVPKQCMLVAPLENPHLNKFIREIQKEVANKFGITLTDADNDPLHISFVTNLNIASAELALLQKYLKQICISTIEIELGSVKVFPNAIYLEIKDTKGQLTKLNQELIKTVRDSGIEFKPRFDNYLPHVTLIFCPGITLSNEDLQEIKILEKQKFYLTEVALMEQNTWKEKTTKQMILPGDIFIASKQMELDYFAGEEKLYLQKEYDNNPLADYYRLLNKLDQYDLITSNKNYDEDAAKIILAECNDIYKKILGYGEDSYPDNLKALTFYARGLIFQYKDRLAVLNYDFDRHLDVASCNFTLAFNMGYIPAAKNLGMVCYELQDFDNAEKYLEIATRTGLSDPHTDRYFSQCFPEQEKISIVDFVSEDKSQEQEKCLVM